MGLALPKDHGGVTGYVPTFRSTYMKDVDNSLKSKCIT